MKHENQVCSLALSIKLKELGVNQNSLDYWIKGSNPKAEYHLAMRGGFDKAYHENDMISAFSIAELCQLLPDSTTNPVISIAKYPSGNYGIEYIYSDIYTKSEKLVEACAFMLIYLIENKLVELKNEHN